MVIIMGQTAKYALELGINSIVDTFKDGQVKQLQNGTIYSIINT